VTTLIRLRDYFLTEAVIPDLHSERSDTVIAEMVAAMSAALRLDETVAADVARQILARERRGSSALGRGFALPHLKHAAVPRVAFTVARSTKGVNFAALDRKPVHLFALTLGPENPPPEYGPLLSRLLGLLENNQNRRFLLTAPTREGMIATVNEA
jgi:mannitol/fructose-specific phosphotransferase system IIA component (Ntr-type)